MLEDLITAVARDAGLPRETAAAAVAVMMRFFTASLPSVLVGELHARLQTRDGADAPRPRDEVTRSR